MNSIVVHRSIVSHHMRALGGVACLILASGCSANVGEGTGSTTDALQGTVGPEGGQLVGQVGSALEGMKLVIPAGALSAKTDITVSRGNSATPLPTTALRCGPEFVIEPQGLKLTAPATVTLPFDENTVTQHDRFDEDVKAWALQDGKWGQRTQTSSSAGQVDIELDSLTTVAAGINPPADTDIVRFSFAPNPKFVNCLAAYPNDASRPPSVRADVVRGSLNDALFLRGENIKANLPFDMFTVQNSSLSADGTPDPNFKNFGLAWYQSDLEADANGAMRASIRTILLDQIFGFDPAANLPPTGTFEVGFWFNNPQDAAACGFDVTKPTPFNGEHNAGPLAMITLPDASTGLGPLCTKPDTSVSPAQCSP
jgi:hypothetical protein